MKRWKATTPEGESREFYTRRDADVHEARERIAQIWTPARAGVTLCVPRLDVLLEVVDE